MIWRVGELLSLEAKSVMRAVFAAALAGRVLIQVIGGIELQPGHRSADLHRDPRQLAMGVGGGEISGTCNGMASDQKYRDYAVRAASGHPPESMVAVRKGTRLSGDHRAAVPVCHWLSLLCGEKGFGWL